MYVIELDGNLIFDPRVDSLKVVNPSLEMEVNTIGNVSFKVYDNNPFYGRFDKLKSIINVYQDDQALPIFRGRVLDTKMDMKKGMFVVCEEIMAYLKDSFYPPFFHQGGFLELLQKVMDNHNSQVQSHQRIELGNVTVTDDNDYILRSSVYPLSTWQLLKTRFVDTNGGYLKLRYASDKVYLDYLVGTTSDLYTSTQQIRFGDNMLDIENDVSASNTYSVVVPIGATIDSPEESGDEMPEQKLTIESVNDGKIYLVDEDALARYGWITAPYELTTWDDVTIPLNLLNKGREFLQATAVKLRSTINLSALDLHNADADISSFRYMDFVQVISDRHNIDDVYMIKKFSLPLANPSGAKISLGETRLSLTDAQYNHNKNVDNTIINIRNDITVNEKQNESNINSITNTMLELSSLLEQTPTMIMSQVASNYLAISEFNSYSEYNSTRFEQTDKAFNMLFDQAIRQIDQVSGDTNQQFSQIKRYIRFVQGNIILGDESSPFSVRISHDRISFLNNNAEMAYLTNDRFYVNNLEAVTTLTLGNFAFIPRASGNLTFSKVR